MDDGPDAGGAELYGSPGQVHRDVPLSPRGQVLWYAIIGALVGLAVGLVIWVAAS